MEQYSHIVQVFAALLVWVCIPLAIAFDLRRFRAGAHPLWDGGDRLLHVMWPHGNFVDYVPFAPSIHRQLEASS